MNAAAKQILIELENGIGRFNNRTVSADIARHATRLLNGQANPESLFKRFAHYEQQGLVQGGPKQPKTASVEKRFLARALRLIVGDLRTA